MVRSRLTGRIPRPRGRGGDACGSPVGSGTGGTDQPEVPEGSKVTTVPVWAAWMIVWDP